MARPPEMSATLTGVDPVLGPNETCCARDGHPLRAHAPEGEAVVAWIWATEETGPLPGASDATFVPDADLIDWQKLFCRLQLASGRVVETPRLTVRRAPPRLLQQFEVEVLDADRPEIISLSKAFDGTGLRYLLPSGGAEVDSRSGAVLVNPALLAGTAQVAGTHVVSVAAENSGGRVVTDLRLVIEPSPDALVPVQAKSDVEIVSDTKQLQRFLDKNIAGTVQLRPGVYGAIRITGAPKDGIRVLEPLDPRNRPEIRQVLFHKGPIQERGFVTFRNILFRNTDTRAYKALVQGAAAQLVLEECELTGDLGYAYQGFDYQYPQVSRGKAVETRQAYGLTLRNCVIRNLAMGLDLAGRDIRVEGCLFDALFTDPITLRAPVEGHTQDVEIIDNEARNPSGDPSILHYDFVQSYPGGGQGGLRRVRIAGNVVYWGPQGLRYPGNGNTSFAQATYDRDTVISRVPGPRERDLYLIDASSGPVTITLPKPDPTMGPHANITLRKIDASPNPVRVTGPSLGMTESLNRQGNTNSYTLNGRGWREKQAAPYIQGIFMQSWSEEHGISGLVICGNIFIGAAAWAIGVGTGGPAVKGGAYVRHVHVMNNTCLPQWPGDSDGDGNANEAHDGYHSSGATIRTWGQAMRVERNIANAVQQSPTSGRSAPTIPFNDTFRRDSYQELAARFTVAGGYVFAPMSRHEAVTLATPPAQSRVPVGFGATTVWDFDNGVPRITAPRLDALPAVTLSRQSSGFVIPVSIAAYATGADFSFFSEGLPQELWLTADGVLQGRARPGHWKIQVQVCNAAGFSTIRDLEITVSK